MINVKVFCYVRSPILNITPHKKLNNHNNERKRFESIIHAFFVRRNKKLLGTHCFCVFVCFSSSPRKICIQTISFHLLLLIVVSLLDSIQSHSLFFFRYWSRFLLSLNFIRVWLFLLPLPFFLPVCVCA